MTAAEGTDEVGVLDFVPVVLGVAAAEDCPDSDISSFGHYDNMEEEKHRKGKAHVYVSDYFLFTGLMDALWQIMGNEYHKANTQSSLCMHGTATQQ